jgi:hypothetical protein
VVGDDDLARGHLGADVFGADPLVPSHGLHLGGKGAGSCELDLGVHVSSVRCDSPYAEKRKGFQKGAMHPLKPFSIAFPKKNLSIRLLTSGDCRVAPSQSRQRSVASLRGMRPFHPVTAAGPSRICTVFRL